MKIVLIGSGNVASHLGPALRKSGHQVIQVYSRNKNHAKELADILKCRFTSRLKDIDHSADLFIVSLTDQATESFAGKFIAGNKIVVHTSGSLPMNVFAGKKNQNIGVLYLLQSFSKSVKIDLKEVPVCIEANNPLTEKKLKTLASSVSKKIFQINSEQRLALHIAAVFANNFTNHILGISDELLKENKLNPELLRSLIDETVRKAMKGDIYKSQTGPAVRGDKKIIRKHLEFLKDYPMEQKIYQLLSKSIASKNK